MERKRRKTARKEDSPETQRMRSQTPRVALFPDRRYLLIFQSLDFLQSSILRLGSRAHQEVNASGPTYRNFTELRRYPTFPLLLSPIYPPSFPLARFALLSPFNLLPATTSNPRHYQSYKDFFSSRAPPINRIPVAVFLPQAFLSFFIALAFYVINLYFNDLFLYFEGGCISLILCSTKFAQR